jgi:hypothetical protein
VILIDLSAPAAEFFSILRSFNYTAMLYDEQSNSVNKPESARRMFCKADNLLLSLIDDGENSEVRLLISKSTNIAHIMGLITAIRVAADKYSLLFHVRQFGRDISLKDLVSNDAVSETAKGHEEMNLLEGMYGTTRSSYLRLESARMIVRHTESIDASKPGARGRKIDRIFCENAQGERFLFPTTNLAPARAMTTHLDHGGNFADAVGQQILRMAQDYANLGACATYVMQNAPVMAEGALTLREDCRCKMREMRKTFERMCRKNGYSEEKSKIETMPLIENEAGSDGLPAELVSEVRALLTVEGVELKDSIVEAACRARRPMQEAKMRESAVSVLGLAVNSMAWNDFKSGRIKLMRKPELSGEYGSPSAATMVKVRELAPLVLDDSLSNLFSHVAARLEVVHDGDELRKLRVIASHALKAVGMDDATLPLKSRAVHEFVEWIGSLAAKSVLSEENDDKDTPEGDLDDEDEIFEALTREDVLLSPKNDGETLKREVTKIAPKDIKGRTMTPDAYTASLVNAAKMRR